MKRKCFFKKWDITFLDCILHFFFRNAVSLNAWHIVVQAACLESDRGIGDWIFFFLEWSIFCTDSLRSSNVAIGNLM